jgi:predicted GNAT family N-acyltransferase
LINPNLKISGFPLTRLSVQHNILSFDCSDADLNDFLLNSAIDYQSKLLAVTYLLEDKNAGQTVAFFSLFNDKISAELFDSNNQWKKRIRSIFASTKQLRDYPSMKIGRLAVSKNYQGKKIGQNILTILKILFITENRTGCRFITVDAYRQSLEFYVKNGFLFFSDKDKDEDTRQMYYDLSRAIESLSPEDLNEIRASIIPH